MLARRRVRAFLWGRLCCGERRPLAEGQGDLRLCRAPRLHQYGHHRGEASVPFSYPLCHYSCLVGLPLGFWRPSVCRPAPAESLAMNITFMGMRGFRWLANKQQATSNTQEHRLRTLEFGPSCDDCSHCATHCSLGPPLSTAGPENCGPSRCVSGKTIATRL